MKINNPHDIAAKDNFKDKKVFLELMKLVLPKEIDEILDHETLENEDTEFVDENMKEYYTDLMFSVESKNKTKLKIYLLLEHKSYPDKNINFQLLSYLSRIYSKMENPTPVIPVIFYHGEKQWRVSVDFIDEFNLSDKEKSLFFKYIPNFATEIIDLQQIDVKKIISSLTLKAIFYTFKYIKEFENLEKFKELVLLSEDLFYEESGMKIVQKLIMYIYNVNDIKVESIRRTVSELISEEKGDEIMTTTAERLINQGLEEGLEQGLEQGIEQGKIQTAQTMISSGLDIQQIVKFTGLPEEKILELRNIH